MYFYDLFSAVEAIKDKLQNGESIKLDISGIYVRTTQDSFGFW